MKCTAKHFRHRVKGHVLTVLRDDGLYRHLQFRKPGTGIDGFDLVTWPGYLCYCGDLGDYVFTRIDDMLEFFRSGAGKINPSYWAEKVVAQDRDGVKEYSAGRARKIIYEILRDHKANRDLRAAVRDEVLYFLDDGEEALRSAVYDFSYQEFEFADFWEYDLTDYTFRFLFCCHAIVWGIQKYDRWKTGHQ